MRKLVNPNRIIRQRPERAKKSKIPLHESAAKHVTGLARYVDDMPEQADILHLAAGCSTIAAGLVKTLDLSLVRSSTGVVAVFTASDVPGHIDIGPVFRGDLLLSDSQVDYMGQPLFFVVATSYEAAQIAERKAKISYETVEPVLTADQALAAKSFVLPAHKIRRGDPETAINNATHHISGNVFIRGQEHFYLEGQVAMALPTEDGGIHVHTSSQHPAEVQKLVAEVLALPFHKVHAEVRRMGGGFGGKETHAAPLACAAALAAYHTGRAVKYRMPRGKDMANTGKRHDFDVDYHIGINAEGLIQGVKITMGALCGCSADLSEGVADRAMFHADNGYFLNNTEIISHRFKTNVVTATAFRGFGGPQGMVVAEAMIEDIARVVGQDPLAIRELNLYAPGRDITHYGQTIEQHILPKLVAQLKLTASYDKRRAAITAFNRQHQYIKKGLALTPVKFGISFTAKHLNQAVALVHIYTDGSIEVAHGGTEMGQGLYTKIAGIVAREFGVPIDAVNVSSTRTDKIANGSPTAASAGTDLNGKAAQNACQQLLDGLRAFAAQHFRVAEAHVIFDAGNMVAGDKSMGFAEFIQLAYFNRVQLSCTGFYKTPKIYYDRETGIGRPFFYFANGAAVSEVLVDTLTGEYRVTAVDICHDVGKSLNSNIDIGQIEGGFVQGMGWVTSEELLWDDEGRVISNSPANYKIPTAFDVPEHFNVELFEEANNEETVFASKAVGEPPLMLGLSVWCAIKDACASVADYRFNPPLNIPATPEQVLKAIAVVKAKVS